MILILPEVRDISDCGTILVNDNLDFNEYSDYNFRSLLNHCISQSDKCILYIDEYNLS